MYCSLSDLKETISLSEIINLTNDDNRDINSIDLTDPQDQVIININKCIKDACTEIDTDLGARYKTPFTAVPDRVVTFAVEISIYNLFLRRRRQILDDTVITRYKQIKDQMKRLGDGFGKLEGAQLITEGTAASGSGEFLGSKTSKDKIFTNIMLKKYL